MPQWLIQVLDVGIMANSQTPVVFNYMNAGIEFVMCIALNPHRSMSSQNQ